MQRFDERNRDIVVNINGRLVPRDEAGVSPFDSAVQGGDAVWEGLRLYDGRIFRLRAHLARLRRSARALAFDRISGDDEMIHQIRRTLEANGMTDGVHIRLTLSRGVKATSGMDPRLNRSGPTLIVLAEFKPPVFGGRGIRLATSSVRRFGPDTLDPKVHHANLIQSILAKVEANAAGADDALMLDARGFVAETNSMNVFAVVGSAWGRPACVVTPRPVACPEGITRQAVLDLCARHTIPCREADLTLAEVYNADEVFCTGTMVEIVPVVEVDGRRIGGGVAGPVTTRLMDLFADLTRAESEPLTTAAAG